MMVRCGRIGAGCVTVSEELLPQCESDLSAVKCNDNFADNSCENQEYCPFTKHLVWGEREVVCQKLWCQISAEQVHYNSFILWFFSVPADIFWDSTINGATVTPLLIFSSSLCNHYVLSCNHSVLYSHELLTVLLNKRRTKEKERKVVCWWFFI